MSPILEVVLRVLAAIVVMLVNGVVLIYMLRKVLAHLHLRLGPMHNGWHGVLQTPFDVVKLVSKEDLVPTKADRWLYMLAPIVVFVPSLLAYAPLPFWNNGVIADLDTGLLFVFAALSVVPLGILMAGWASGNKYALIGGMRAAAQQIAYEVPLLISVLGVAMMAGSLNLSDIIAAQNGHWLGFIPKWFIIPQIGAFALFLVAGLAELNQTPFDMSEAESELVAGYATEYAAMRFGLMFLAEFSNSFIISGLGVVLFFGGWHSGIGGAAGQWMDANLGPMIFVLKTYIGIFVLMWIRGTMPRIRIDQLLAVSWKALIPLSIAWVAVVALLLKLLKVVA